MKWKIMRWILPAFAGVSIVGTGFSVFYFTSGISDTTKELGPQIQIEAIADSGELDVVPLIEDDDGSYHTIEDDETPLLVISQRSVTFDFDLFGLYYTSGDNIDRPVNVSFSATMRLGSSTEFYLDVTGWNYDEDENLYLLDDAISVVAQGADQIFDVITVTPPEFTFSDPLITTQDVKEMKDALIDESIQFTFYASVSGV